MSGKNDYYTEEKRPKSDFSLECIENYKIVRRPQEMGTNLIKFRID